MDKQTLKVIYRKSHTKEFGNVIVAFFPELSANFGNIVCYDDYDHCHGEASLEYYRTTVPAKPEEYAELHKHLTALYGSPFGENDPPVELTIRRRMPCKDLSSAWRM